MKTALLPTPTVELVQTECDAFDQDYPVVEESLNLLWSAFPHNTEPSQVFLKVLVLNQLYSTRVDVVDIELLARHIAGLSIDPLLDQGALEAVRLITNCPGLKKKYLSFASKYCSRHRPEIYPIWDGNARACLWAYKKQDLFAPFHNYDLWNYEKFLELVIAFRTKYSLTCFTLRQLDKFLYRFGGRILREEF
jgi:hypothetical protein